MAFQLGTVDFMVKEVLPKLLNGRGAVMSLSRYKITSPRELLLGYLEKEGLGENLEPLRTAETLTSNELFQAFGFSRYDDLDFLPGAATLVQDLNQPLPEKLRGQYDLVVECGTMEHVFDVKATFSNIIRALKVGGLAFHMSPLDLINHGFYNFSPTLFFDVYRSNGFDPLWFHLVHFPLNWWKNQEIRYRPLEFVPGRFVPEVPKKHFAMISCMARKQSDLGEFRTPIQAIYDPDLGLDPVF